MTKCKVDLCESKVSSKGYCNKHYHKFVRYGNPEISKNNFGKRVLCKVEGCFIRPHAKGYCRSHYSSVTNYNREFLVKPTYGSGYIRDDGYREISVNGTRVLEHVYLAEQALGRKLKNGEEVHHMNENRADNHTPFNLVICPSRLYHKLLHKRIAAAKAVSKTVTELGL